MSVNVVQHWHTNLATPYVSLSSFYPQCTDLIQIIVEDEDGEVVKKYELPDKKKEKKAHQDDGEAGPVRQGINRMGTWTGMGKKDGPSSAADKDTSSPVRQGINRMGTWAGNKPADPKKKKQAEEEDEDDHRIRFTIGGAGKRMTKEDFLRELQNMDPKARMEVVESSSAPKAMKDLAKRDASENSPGSSRLLGAKTTQLAAGEREAELVAKAMAAKQGAEVPLDSEEDGSGGSTGESSEEEDVGPVQRRREALRRQQASASSPSKAASSPEDEGAALEKIESPSRLIPETAAERKRREQVLKGVEDADSEDDGGRVPETPAEKRRREAALKGGAESDSDDDNTERVPQPRRTGIRFAAEPVRGRKK
jgi:hypothetical protein